MPPHARTAASLGICLVTDLFQLVDPQSLHRKALIERLGLPTADLVQEVFFEPDLGKMHPFAGCVSNVVEILWRRSPSGLICT